MTIPDRRRLRNPSRYGRGNQQAKRSEKPDSFRVVIADDNAPLRAGLKRLLEDDGLQVVGLARTGKQAVELTASLKPDVVVLNIRMPSMDGLQALTVIKSSQPETKVLIYTGFSDPTYLSQAIANGASGFLVKDRSPIHIPDAVRAVALGETIVDRNLLETLLTTIGKLGPAGPPQGYSDASGLKRIIREYGKSTKADDS